MSDAAKEPRHILIIEDDASISAGLALNLRVEGYVAHVANDGQAGIDQARALAPTLIILDLSLPKKNGLEILAELRASGDRTPIVILSARDAEADVVAALKLGADDYVSKPFGLAELLARVAAVLRRAQAAPPASVPAAVLAPPPVPAEVPAVSPHGPGEQLVVGDIVIGVDTRVVQRAGKEVKLTRLEFDLLLHFARHLGKVLSRDRLLRDVWDVHHDGSQRTVDNFVAQLRSKIEADPDHPRHLVTVRGAGYRLDP
jgi:two-component system alkaline phosphatase synthesis response regulator PhoP